MSYHQDWLMRQIEAVIQLLRYLLTGERPSLLLPDFGGEQPSGTNALYLQLQLLVRQGAICQAEDLLFEYLQQPDRQVLEAAVQFYEDLSDLSDETLQAANFSRQEIYEGLQYVCRICGIPYM